MMRKLNLRLTILFTILTSLILLSTLLISWRLSVRQYETNTRTIFENCFDAIADRISSGTVLRDSWLAGQESDNDCIIFIEDGGTALHFSGVHQSATPRELLIANAKEVSLSNADSSLFQIKGQHSDTYSVIYSTISMETASPDSGSVQLWILFDYSFVQKHIFRITISYLILWVLGSLLLFPVSYLLIRLAGRPTEEAIRQQNEFVAAASHELRSPLTVMKANLCAIRETDAKKTDDIDSMISIAEKEVSRMQHLTDDLLLLAGSDANALSTSLRPVPLDTLLIEVYETYMTLAKQMEHPFEILLPERELPAVTADEERLKQLLGIFLNNAFVYSGSGAPVSLTADRGRGFVTISVIDHGRGICDEEKKLIFRRFYQGDKSRTDKSHFGLGLSVAREIARSHQTSIKVNDTPGGGVTFSVQFAVGKL